MRFDRMITAVDAHAAGEPGRVITGGVLDVPGATMLDKMAHLRDHADDLRKLMLREPRGYPAANCNLILPPTIAGADAGYVIMEQVEYPAMSGSNTICVVTVLIETGMVPVVEPVTTLRLESPAGLIEVQAEVRDGRVLSVTFRNVPAFAVHLDALLEVPHLGTVTVDVAWGGMFYVIADAERFGLRITPDEARDIVRIGEMVKLAAQEQSARPPSGESGPDDRGDDLPDLGSGPCARRIAAQRGDRVNRPGQLGSAGELDRRDRPFAMWDGDEREDGLRACPWPSGARSAVRPRGHPGHDLHRPAGGRNEGWRLCRGGPHDQRSGLDHRLCPVRPGARRPLPGRLHPDRHLGDGELAAT